MLSISVFSSVSSWSLSCSIFTSAASTLRRFSAMPTSSQNVHSASSSDSEKGCALGTLLIACT